MENLQDDFEKSEIIDFAKSLRNFLGGNSEAGEKLYAASAVRDSSVNLVEIEKFWDCISFIVEENQSVRLSELSIGILANLTLCGHIQSDIINQFNLVKLVITCFSKTDDPMVFKEGFRFLTNILSNGFSNSLNDELKLITLSIDFSFENSVHPELLCQTSQLLYYLLKSAKRFKESTMLKSWDVFKTLTSLVKDKDMIHLLRKESLNNCTGLEWILFCIDYLISDEYTNFYIHDADGKVNSTILNSMLNILSSAMIEDKLSVSESFSVLSIVDGILRQEEGYKTSEDSKIDSSNIINETFKSFVLKEENVRIICSLWEESIIMREIESIESISGIISRICFYFINYKVSEKDIFCDKIKSFVDNLKEPLELINDEETIKWINKQIPSENFMNFLLVLNNISSLLKHENGGKIKIKITLLVDNSIDKIDANK